MSFFSNRRHIIAAGLYAAVAGLSVPHSAAQAAPPQRILVLGDSLSAEYGLRRGSGWVALMHDRLVADFPQARLINASISGETTSGGRSRLAALLAQHQPTQVIIELGANDGLRGLPLSSTQDNLTQMIRASQKAGARVLVIGMMLPPNFGQDFSRKFAAMYKTVAQTHRTGLVPFLLKGVADAADPLTLFQSDRIHPNEQAQGMLLDNVWPELKKILP